MLDPLFERYGWTWNYVLWEVSFLNIIMLVADNVTVYMRDKDIDRQIGNEVQGSQKYEEFINLMKGL